MPKRRGRSESMIKLANQQKESKLWHEEANSQVKAGNLIKALYSYNKALELNPLEKNALVARSRCHILLGQPEEALKDAEAALTIDNTFIKGIVQKAESLYYLGDFEHSLMYYHRGLRLRPDHEGFKLGVHKAQKAIENAIGSSFIGKSNSKKSTPKSSKQTTAREKVSNQEGNVGDSASKSGSATEIAASKTSHRNTPLIKKPQKKCRLLLRELAVDKEYLDNLLTNPDIKCKYKEKDEVIIEYIQEAIDFLNTRQEFWRQQLPTNLK